jgi:hypothetical protein
MSDESAVNPTPILPTEPASVPTPVPAVPAPTPASPSTPEALTDAVANAKKQLEDELDKMLAKLGDTKKGGNDDASNRKRRGNWFQRFFLG